MSNPFEDSESTFVVLVNDEGQHSLWPSYVEVPAGWTKAFGDAGREACLAFVEESWRDMRPKSLVEAMEATPR